MRSLELCVPNTDYETNIVFRGLRCLDILCEKDLAGGHLRQLFRLWSDLQNAARALRVALTARSNQRANTFDKARIAPSKRPRRWGGFWKVLALDAGRRSQSRIFIENCFPPIREGSICSTTRDCSRRSLAWSVAPHEAAATASTTRRARTTTWRMLRRAWSPRWRRATTNTTPWIGSAAQIAAANPLRRRVTIAGPELTPSGPPCTI
jgi:hypothetical protein